jgi:hypothetical protein
MFKSSTTNITLLGTSNTTFHLHLTYTAVTSLAQKTQMPLAYNQPLSTVHTKLERLLSYQDGGCFPAQTWWCCQHFPVKPVAVCLIMPLPKHSLEMYPTFLKHKHNHPFFYFFCITLIWGPYMLFKCNSHTLIGL